VRVTAVSIQRAESLVDGSYPDSDAKIDFPIAGTTFILGDVDPQREQPSSKSRAADRPSVEPGTLICSSFTSSLLATV
jgi:hypothetical protein